MLILLTYTVHFSTLCWCYMRFLFSGLRFGSPETLRVYNAGTQVLLPEGVISSKYFSTQAQSNILDFAATPATSYSILVTHQYL